MLFPDCGACGVEGCGYCECPDCREYRACLECGALCCACKCDCADACNAHQHAGSRIRDLASAFEAKHGMPCHPVTGKVPHVRWRNTSSVHEYLEVEWFNATGFGVRLVGHSVVDVDRPPGPDLPPTLTVKTAKGSHHYFRGTAKSAVYSWGDFKSGDGHQVVGPGSLHADTGAPYTVERDLPIAPLPALAPPEKDSDSSPASQTSWEEGGRNNALFEHLKDLWSPKFEESQFLLYARALNLALCSPPLSDDEVDKTARSVFHYYQESATASTATDAYSQFKDAVMSAGKVSSLPPVSAIFERMLSHTKFHFIAGPEGSGKSFVAFDLAARMADGRDVTDYDGNLLTITDANHQENKAGRFLPRNPLRVLYLYLEDGTAVLPDRIKAAGLEDSNVLIYTEYLNLQIEDTWPGIRQAIIDMQIDVLFVDTMQECRGAWEENSSTEMGLFLNRFKELDDGKGRDVTVVIVTHFGKDSERGARGSSALRGSAHTMMEVKNFDVNRMTTDIVVTKNRSGPKYSLTAHFAPTATSLRVTGYTVGTRANDDSPASDRDAAPYDSGCLQRIVEAIDCAAALEGEQSPLSLGYGMRSWVSFARDTLVACGVKPPSGDHNRLLKADLFEIVGLQKFRVQDDQSASGYTHVYAREEPARAERVHPHSDPIVDRAIRILKAEMTE